ncbi:hypothetical protein D9M73_145140 [compost metagenome]
MDGAGDQPVDLVEGEHHGAEHHVVLQLLFGHRRVEVLALAQAAHRLDVAAAHQVRVDDLQVFRQFHAEHLRHRLDVVRLGQQHAAGNVARVADHRRLHGARLAALGQDDALVRLARPLRQLVAEHRRRQVQFPGFAAALLEPFEVDVPGDVLGDPLRALAVVHRDFLVHPVEVAGGLERTAANRQHRQSALEGAAAEFHDPWVGHQVAAQQQAGQRHAVHGR